MDKDNQRPKDSKWEGSCRCKVRAFCSICGGRRICLDMVQLLLVEAVKTVPYLIMNTCQYMRPVHALLSHAGGACHCASAF